MGLPVVNNHLVTVEWQDQGACNDKKFVRYFYPSRGSSIKDAKKVCHTKCSVREACLEYALQTNENHGVWGGMSVRERRALRRQRRLAKAS